MANKEPLIEPLSYHGPGGCPVCFTPLVLADRETNVMDLDKSGNVVSIVDTVVTCTAMCPKCGHKQKMMRSNGIYRPYSEIVQIFDRLEIEDEINRRNNGKYSVEGNPLVSND